MIIQLHSIIIRLVQKNLTFKKIIAVHTHTFQGAFSVNASLIIRLIVSGTE